MASVTLVIGIAFCERAVMPEWAIALTHLCVSMPINTSYRLSVCRSTAEQRLPIAEVRNDDLRPN